MSTSVLRSCYRCGYFAETAEAVCPRCERGLHTATATRIRGALLAVLGAILTFFMVYLVSWALAAFRATDPTGARFTGDEQQKLVILGLFGLLIAFGLMSFAIGMYQVVVGRRSKGFVRAIVTIAGLIGLGGAYVIWSF